MNVAELFINATPVYLTRREKLDRCYFQTLFHLVTTPGERNACDLLEKKEKKIKQSRQVICLALLHDRENSIHLAGSLSGFRSEGQRRTRWMSKGSRAFARLWREHGAPYLLGRASLMFAK